LLSIVSNFLGLEAKDPKTAAAIQRKIVMKGCNKPWILAIRQILMNLETIQAANNEPEVLANPTLLETPAENPIETSADPTTKTEWI
jgi:hypothetical protein